MWLVLVEDDEPTEPDAIRQCPACVSPVGGPMPGADDDTRFFDAFSCSLCKGVGVVSSSRAVAYVAEQAEHSTVRPPPPKIPR